MTLAFLIRFNSLYCFTRISCARQVSILCEPIRLSMSHEQYHGALHMLFNALHHQVCCAVSSKPITRSHTCIHRRKTANLNKSLQTIVFSMFCPLFRFSSSSAGQHFKHHLASRPPAPVRGHARAWWRHALAAVVGIIRSRRERFSFRTIISMYVLVYFLDAQPRIS